MDFNILSIAQGHLRTVLGTLLSSLGSLGKMALFAKILESLEIGFLVMVLESLGVAKILKVVLKCVCTDVSYMPEAFEPRFWSGLSPLPLI